MSSKDKLYNIRHSLAHILAMAVLRRFPNAKLGIGPVIENGFYYDFDLPERVSENDLPTLEEEMRRIIKEKIDFEKKIIGAQEAKKLFKTNSYKLELIEELPENEEISIYQSGGFIDLCKGGHVKNSAEINQNSFKLARLAGAYWRGSEKNKMLTRIYGLAFETKDELMKYLKMLEEAEKRDHRKIGKELDLFSFHDEGPGFAFWHPKGATLYRIVENFIRNENEKRGYREIKTPMLLKKNLWVSSGHWDKFRDDMYFTEIDGEEFAIKPMNCPGGVLIYNEKIHSWRDLPTRLAEFGIVHRHELSGVLHGLLRARVFTQDDAHSFCLPEQLNDEVGRMTDYALDIYKTFGFEEYEIFIATRPEKYIGDDKAWNEATKALKDSLESKELEYKIKEGEGAFYGPKIEFNIKDAIGRNWQMGTIQVDFSMPVRLGATYIDKNGAKKNPVMVHRAILGSIERFVAILIEHYAGALPFRLAPEQVRVIPISEKFEKYAGAVKEKLAENKIRASLAPGNETLGKQIRAAEKMKIPYILVVGEQEEKSGEVAVRKRSEGDIGKIKLETLQKSLANENIL